MLLLLLALSCDISLHLTEGLHTLPRKSLANGAGSRTAHSPAASDEVVAVVGTSGNILVDRDAVTSSMQHDLEANHNVKEEVEEQASERMLAYLERVKRVKRVKDKTQRPRQKSKSVDASLMAKGNTGKAIHTTTTTTRPRMRP